MRIAETRYDGGLYLGTNASGTKYKFIVNTAIRRDWHVRSGLRVCGGWDGDAGLASGDGDVRWHCWQGCTWTALLVASETFTAPPNTNYPLYVGRMLRGEWIQLEWRY